MMLAALVLALALTAAPSAEASCCSGMVMSQNGLQLTESFEGLVQHVYDDSAGNPTVCYGHLVLPGQHFPAHVSMSECESLLRQDMGSAESCVRNAVNVNLNQNQFDALVDFTYNAGCGSLQSSTLLRDLNANDYSAVPAQLLRWDHAGGRVLPGLERRRRAEGNLWSTGDSGDGNGMSPGLSQNPPPPPPTPVVGVTCNGGVGTCINTDNTQCSGSIEHGLCGGGQNILCCQSGGGGTVGVGDSCSNGQGTCINSDQTSCTGSLEHNLCPGPDNVLCCVKTTGTSCDNGGGKCINVDQTTCSSSTIVGICPGPDAVQCCPNSGSDDDDSYGYFQEQHKSKKLSEGATGGIVAACVGVVVLVAAVGLIIWNRRRGEVLDLAKSEALLPGDDVFSN
eukprot:m.476938 g.476938  ORF g.476938 m.476938 type:complete len:395 (+) comp20709_c0_seq1:662-1846(+)